MAWTINNGKLYFNSVLYTGNGGTQSITSLDFAPNWVWIKSRSTVRNNVLNDTVRGATKNLFSNTTGAEATDTETLTSFNSDGFTLGDSAKVNENGTTFASWNWKAGTSFTNDASATGIGSIDSSGSVSTDAGFSIITYTGTGSAATVAHGLGVAPKMIINRTISAAKDWITYHASLGATKFVELNTTDAAATSSDKFNNTDPTSTVFSIESSSQNNTSGGTCLAYCFAEKKGYSKFGSYTGNGNADGTFVYTGFKPAFVMTKRTDTTSDWYLSDNKRNGFNDDNHVFYANESDAEKTVNRIDILSNGFKLRSTGSGVNASGGSYIYMAFAENPFTSSAGTPVMAR